MSFLARAPRFATTGGVGDGATLLDDATRAALLAAPGMVAVEIRMHV